MPYMRMYGTQYAHFVAVVSLYGKVLGNPNSKLASTDCLKKCAVNLSLVSIPHIIKRRIKDDRLH